jgi:E3 ubiquitin-protein ligase SHPRH
MAIALSNCFWRTSKSDVIDQLGLPPQTTAVKKFKFSPVEQHFYMRQQNECQLRFNEKMISFTDLNIRLNELDKKTVNILLKPLLSLRLVC